MPFSHFIAHQIRRATPDSPAEVRTRSDQIALSGPVEESLRELKLGYVKKLSKIHGQFSDIYADYPVSQWIREFLEEKLSFESMTEKAMKQFKHILDATECTVDVYVLFAVETLQHTHDLYIFLASHKHGHYIDGDISFTATQFLDTEQLDLAARINLKEWQAQDEHLSYLSLLVWRGEKDLNDAFLNWLGFANKTNVKEQTDAFIEAVESYARQQPEELAFETREKVVNYCIEQDKIGKKVNLIDLSEQVNENDQNEFVQHVQKSQPTIKEEIIPDRSQLRQYIRISGRNELLSMSFDSKCLGETIIYDQDSDSLVINKIPSALKNRLVKHMLKSSGN